MSGKFSRSKGLRAERGIVAALNEAGLEACRVPLSGSAGGRFSGDIIFKLGDNDFLVVKADRERPLAVVPLAVLLEIIEDIRIGGQP